ncbi:butyrophilin-like protein 9 [Plectropomus leopardus]|uniref:butyrophilin-like protein 9 n=1 Tax=Plectropomus leopardus TaxID=160734 RepID=UPI001C4C1402|nr:butyrophilin-like protein 9 [Plectropomus leopardus]
MNPDPEFKIFHTAYRSISLFGCFCIRIFPLFLLAALMSCCAGKFRGKVSEGSAPVKIQVFVGQTVLLPCSSPYSDDDPTVEWSHQGVNVKMAFVYRHGCETFQEKHFAFYHRTNLILNKVHEGNFSMWLSNTKLSDAGKFVCKHVPRVVATVELFVVAISEPKLSVVSAAGDEVTLQCEASCWFPEPEITFLGIQGDISDANTQTDPSTGCFTATRKVTVQTAERVTCRVHQPKINEMRLAEIIIPDKCIRRKEREETSCTTLTAIIVVLIIVIIGLCALIIFLYKTGYNFKKSPKMQPPQSPMCSNAEGHNLGNQADFSVIVPTEHPSISELESTLQVKDETIHQLTEQLKDLRAQQIPVVCQLCQTTFNESPKSSTDVSEPANPSSDPFLHNKNPKPAPSDDSNRPQFSTSPQKRAVSFQTIQKSSRNHSSPTRLPKGGASSAPPSEETQVVRSMSGSMSRPRSNKPQRRHTTIASCDNRYTVRQTSFEDSEPLL